MKYLKPSFYSHLSLILLFLGCQEKSHIRSKEFLVLPFEKAISESECLPEKKQGLYLYRFIINKINTRQDRDSIDLLLKEVESLAIREDNQLLENYLLQARSFYNVSYGLS